LIIRAGDPGFSKNVFQRGNVEYRRRQGLLQPPVLVLARLELLGLGHPEAADLPFHR
jgi:hypothetical protein